MSHDILIILPVCTFDIDRFGDFIYNIEFFKTKIHTKAVLIYKIINNNTTKNRLIEDFIIRLNNIFDTVEYLEIYEPKKLYWSLSVSNSFTQTCRYLIESNNTLPFYFLEPDNTFLNINWYNNIVNEYYNESHIFLGNIATINPRYKNKGKNVLVGGAIYPNNVYDYIEEFIDTDFNNNTKTLIEDSAIPFDVIIAAKIIEHSKQSKYMLNVWSSKQFKYLNDDKYEYRKSSNVARQISIGDNINIFHGCKDNSLFNTYFNRYNL